jgi:ADP-ribose pyrophosphatase YjhB (NUDIX family)
MNNHQFSNTLLVMKFCSTCAHSVELVVPPDDNRPRYCCAGCGAVHYQNPKNVVGTIPTWQGKVLLCKRAIEPRHGYWTLPAGFMENDETCDEGAARETVEEAGAQINTESPLKLFSIVDVPAVHQVHLFFLAPLINDVLDPGPETLEAQFFSEQDIPWKDLAFKTVSETLKWFFEARQANDYTLRHGAVRWKMPKDKTSAD